MARETQGQVAVAQPEPTITFKVAATAEELSGYHELRRQVFVVEQGLFDGTDVDAHDAHAIPIVALRGGKVVGVVRCYPEPGGVWFGGRLAVHPDHRAGTLGARLVKRAVETMEARGDVLRFLAQVQSQNVGFFERLGWVRRGAPFLLRGREHQLMEQPLGRGLSHTGP